ncbi:hypothetical protein CC78DRAFT_536690 [Lojkania enalia]|uniref:Uncharacterized protein n=1 Tax=Lojkania enalia TaxID=147567 RepID=A0A9P4K267_9PLEO|nr:hypothetical protein CC78DRAFT_536690 [Didymosphaeria enalia]
MSGNPFRIPQFQKQTAAPAPAPNVSFIDTDSNAAEYPAHDVDSERTSSVPLTKTKKSVRIKSPTTSLHSAFDDVNDALSQRVSRGKHSGSPPPPPPAASSETLRDQAAQLPFDEDSSHGDHAYRTQDTIGSSRMNSEMREGIQSLSGIPANPFARTLATIEPQEKGSGEFADTARHNKDRSTSDKLGLGPAKALDVEGFKRLLMTGISSSPSNPGGSQQPTAAPNPAAPSVFESSSSTDTSSISRQSIFEPVQEPHIETPRTSYEMALSDDDERAGLVGEGKKGEKKKAPPPAPKHRHGKLVTSRTPQTVSFSDFTASTSPQTTQTMPPTSSRPRTDSDLNKPLPPPPALSPPAHITSQDKSLDGPPALETKSSESSGQSDAPPQKKQPPPVPLARRQSQLRSSTIGNRSRSNSSLTMSSQHSAEFPIWSPGPTHETASQFQSIKSPPPPPPTRRHGASITASSANSSTTELPSISTPRRANVSTPNLPASRRTVVSSPPPSPAPGPGLTRTSSTRSAQNPRSIPNESASMPPPPPPPRRRQSGRRSLDTDRLSHPLSLSLYEPRRASLENKRNSLEAIRRTSVASESSLRHEYSPAIENEQALYSPKEELTEEPRALEPAQSTTSNSSNILDDMERFQREIDELREKYKQAG